MNLVKSVIYALTGTRNPLELAGFVVYGAFLLFVINSVMMGV